MDSAPDLSSCDELWLSQITTMGWEKAYKTACEQVDAQLAKITHLEMQLAAIETQNICLTRENQRLNLTMRHLVSSNTCWKISLLMPFRHLGALRHQLRHHSQLLLLEAVMIPLLAAKTRPSLPARFLAMTGNYRSTLTQNWKLTPNWWMLRARNVDARLIAKTAQWKRRTQNSWIFSICSRTKSTSKG